MVPELSHLPPRRVAGEAPELIGHTLSCVQQGLGMVQNASSLGSSGTLAGAVPELNG